MFGFLKKLERMERYALDDSSALVVMNDAALTDGELNDTGLTKQGQIASAGMTSSSFVMGCCAVVRRELLDACLPIPTHYKGHDGWIVKMAEGVGRKRVVSDVLQWYRRHDENESQFIANRTTKVTRGMAFRRTLMNAFLGNDPHKQLSTATDQARCFLEGVRDASTRAVEPLSAALSKYAVELEARLMAVEQRRMVRVKPRLARLPAIVDLWRGGGYALTPTFRVPEGGAALTDETCAQAQRNRCVIMVRPEQRLIRRSDRDKRSHRALHQGPVSHGFRRADPDRHQSRHWPNHRPR